MSEKRNMFKRRGKKAESATNEESKAPQTEEQDLSQQDQEELNEHLSQQEEQEQSTAKEKAAAATDRKEEENKNPPSQEKAVATRQSAPPPEIHEDAAPEILSLANNLDPVRYGRVFPKLKGSGGSVKGDNVGKLGKYVDLQVISFHKRTFITPGSDPSDKAAKKLCRASYDGITIPGMGENPKMSVDDYIAQLPEKYKDSVRKVSYFDVIGIVINSAENAEKAKEAGIFSLQLSPTSHNSWDSFTMQVPFNVLRGKMVKEHQNCVRAVAQDNEEDGNEYTNFTFEPVPLEVLENYTQIPTPAGRSTRK